MTHKILFTVGGAFLAATLLFMFGNALTASADPRTESWDEIFCISPIDVNGGGADLCTSVNGNPTYADNGTPGTMDIGDNPETVSNVWFDTVLADNGGPPNEALYDESTAMWTGGITTTPGALLTTGDQAGQISFVLNSNLLYPIFNNIDPTTGQPPTCQYSTLSPPDGSKLGATFPMYVATLNLTPTITYKDSGGVVGVPQTLEDHFGNGGSVGANGIYDGIDMMPSPLPMMIINLGLPSSSMVERLFGRALVATIGTTLVTQDVNFLTFDLGPGQGFLDLTIVAYPGLPLEKPVGGANTNVLFQTVLTCPPYLASPVRVFGKTVGNSTVCDGPGCAGSPAPVGIPGGAPFRNVVANGTYEYDISYSHRADYDGDGFVSGYQDLCWKDSSNADPNTNGLAGICDTGPNPTGTTNACVAAGQTVKYVPPFPTCQDIDQDGFLNAVDNCPNVANGSGADIQLDTDRDYVGDACEKLLPTPKAELIPGDGKGYTGAAGLKFMDNDNFCVDQFIIPAADTATGAEPAGETDNPSGARKYCLASQSGGAPTDNPDQLYANPPAANRLQEQSNGAVTTFNDSNDNGVPDYLVYAAFGGWPALSLYDANSDSDIDGFSDACEGFNGTDALNPAITPGPPAVGRVLGGGDCDGGGVPDYLEKLNGTDFRNPADDGTMPVVDTDNDSCTDSEELGLAQGLGGVRNPMNAWDFYDVPLPVGAPGTGVRDRQVDGNDALGVLAKFGASPGDPIPSAPKYDLAYDRSAPTPNAWNTQAPNGVMDGNDVLWNLAQFGHSCVPVPNIGRLTVTKVLSPTSDTGKFNLRINGHTYMENVGNNGKIKDISLVAGNYTVSETAGTGTSLANYTTVIGGACAIDGTVTLAPGDNKTCTITNTRNP